MFSNCHVTEDSKRTAYPVQFHWLRQDLKWIHKLKRGELRCHDASDYYKFDQDGLGPAGRTKILNLHQSNPKSRHSHKSHPYHFGSYTVATHTVGALEHRLCIVNRNTPITRKIHPKDPSSWLSVQKCIKEQVYPTLYSWKEFQKLQNGELQCWQDRVKYLTDTGQISR